MYLTITTLPYIRGTTNKCVTNQRIFYPIFLIIIFVADIEIFFCHFSFHFVISVECLFISFCNYLWMLRRYDKTSFFYNKNIDTAKFCKVPVTISQKCFANELPINAWSCVDTNQTPLILKCSKINRPMNIWKPLYSLLIGIKPKYHTWNCFANPHPLHLRMPKAKGTHSQRCSRYFAANFAQ